MKIGVNPPHARASWLVLCGYRGRRWTSIWVSPQLFGDPVVKNFGYPPSPGGLMGDKSRGVPKKKIDRFSRAVDMHSPWDVSERFHTPVAASASVSSPLRGRIGAPTPILYENLAICKKLFVVPVLFSPKQNLKYMKIMKNP